MKKITLLAIGLICITAIAIMWVKQPQELSGRGNQRSLKCVTSTVTAVTLGADLSTNIISTSSARAYTRIQQPINATNTVSLILDEGIKATIGNGIELTTASSTSPVPYLEFGLNTDFPYTGTVTGITNTGSTTLLVTSCAY